MSAPTKDEIAAAIRACGSDHAGMFGYPVREDGLYLQQDVGEYSDFVHFMTQQPPSRLAIEIGVASGGQTKFLRDHYQIDKTIIVDIGLHPNHHHWKRIKPTVKTEFVLEIIGDSHAASTREKLLRYARTIDFAFVDGDHSYKGLKQDMFLMKDLLKPGALCVLHDTHEVKDCARVFEELKRSEDFELVENFVSRFGISVWRYTGAGGGTTSWFNRRFGWGKL